MNSRHKVAKTYIKRLLYFKKIALAGPQCNGYLVKGGRADGAVVDVGVVRVDLEVAGQGRVAEETLAAMTAR